MYIQQWYALHRLRQSGTHKHAQSTDHQRFRHSKKKHFQFDIAKKFYFRRPSIGVLNMWRRSKAKKKKQFNQTIERKEFMVC